MSDGYMMGRTTTPTGCCPSCCDICCDNNTQDKPNGFCCCSCEESAHVCNCVSKVNEICMESMKLETCECSFGHVSPTNLLCWYSIGSNSTYYTRSLSAGLFVLFPLLVIAVLMFEILMWTGLLLLIIVLTILAVISMAILVTLGMQDDYWPSMDDVPQTTTHYWVRTV